MKVVACCIARTENRYLAEWLDWHLALGFDHIYLCDNAQGEEERLSEVVDANPAYRERVTVYPYIDRGSQQVRAYTDCYMNRDLDFDWMAFFDMDEFITFAASPADGRPLYTDIHDFLSERASDADEVLLNWMLYGDNGLVHDDGRPNHERFARPLPYDFSPYNIWTARPMNCHVKHILRRGLPVEKVLIHSTPAADGQPPLRAVDGDGKSVQVLNVQPRYTFATAYIRHYYTRTIEEYISTKIKRGKCADNAAVSYDLGTFFLYNRVTPSKLRRYRDAARRYPNNHTHHTLSWWIKVVVKGYVFVPMLGWRQRLRLSRAAD